MVVVVLLLVLELMLGCEREVGRRGSSSLCSEVRRQRCFELGE